MQKGAGSPTHDTEVHLVGPDLYPVAVWPPAHSWLGKMTEYDEAFCCAADLDYGGEPPQQAKAIPTSTNLVQECELGEAGP